MATGPLPGQAGLPYFDFTQEELKGNLTAFNDYLRQVSEEVNYLCRKTPRVFTESFPLDVNEESGKTPGYLSRIFGESGMPGMLFGNTDGKSGGRGMEMRFDMDAQKAVLFSFNRDLGKFKKMTIDANPLLLNSVVGFGGPGPVGIGVFNPALDTWLHIAAIDGLADKRVPLRFNQGALGLNTPVDGSWEYFGGILYFTIGNVRCQVCPSATGNGVVTIGDENAPVVDLLLDDDFINSYDDFGAAHYVNFSAIGGFTHVTSTVRHQGIVQLHANSTTGAEVLIATGDFGHGVLLTDPDIHVEIVWKETGPNCQAGVAFNALPPSKGAFQTFAQAGSADADGFKTTRIDGGSPPTLANGSGTVAFDAPPAFQGGDLYIYGKTPSGGQAEFQVDRWRVWQDVT